MIISLILYKVLKMKEYKGFIYRYDKDNGIMYRNDTVIAENIAASVFSMTTEKVENTDKNIIRVDMILGNKNTVRRQVDYTLKYY